MKCESPSTTPVAPVIPTTPNQTIQCGSNQVLGIDSNGNQVCQCPQSAPYFNGNTCVSCFLPNYWNRTSLVC